MSLSKLNHDCLFAAFSHLPPQKQLHLRLVSTSWCANLEAHLRLQRSLVISFIPYHGEYSSHLENTIFALTNPLKLSPDRLNANFCRNFSIKSLYRLFPNISKLQIFPLASYFKNEEFRCSSILLEALAQWSSTLTTLALNYHGTESSLWSSLSSLSSLRHLHLHSIKFTSKTIEEIVVPNIFRQLQVFSVVNLVDLSFLSYLGPNLRELHLNTAADLVFQIISKAPQLVLSSVQVLHLQKVYFALYSKRGDESIFNGLLMLFPSLKRIVICKKNKISEKKYLAKLATHHGFTLTEK